MKKMIKKLTIGAGLAACLVASSAFAQEATAIMNARVLTAAGDVIENGDVIIRDGQIAQVGADLSAPQGATVIDGAGKVVTPGLFAPFTTIGLEEIGLDAEANDAGPDRASNFPLGAALNAADAIRPASSLIPINRAGGVTRAVTAPAPGASLFGGAAAVIDLSGETNSITRRAVAQVLVLGYSGASRAGDTRMGAWAILRETLDQARRYNSDPEAFLRTGDATRYRAADLRALAPVLAGEMPLLVSINGESDIRNLIRLKNEYGLRVIILGGSEAWKAADALGAANIPVILNPTANLPSQFEDLGATLRNAALLDEAGVAIAFYGTESGSHNISAVTQLAGNAVANGLDYDTAIAALTRNPAEMFGVGDEFGTIAPGRAADIVVWSGDPLEVTSAPEAVFIAGVRQDLENRQSALRERYRDLSRGDLPIAYRGGAPDPD